MERTLKAMALLVCFLLLASTGFAADHIGTIKKLSGTATITRNSDQLDAAIGMHIYKQDVLTTGKKSSLGFILRDNTLISMGPESSLSVARFDFAPREGKLGLLTRMTKGTASYLSGTIGKLAPEAVAFETPNTTIGIRGTHFLVKVVPD